MKIPESTTYCAINNAELENLIIVINRDNINNLNNLIGIELEVKNKNSKEFRIARKIDQIFFSDDGRFKPIAG